MASRKTLKEAESLRDEFQARHPAATFRIIDNSKTMNIGRVVAMMDGYDIVKDDGAIMVTAKVTRFDVVEVRHCSCGAEILTAAIGENGIDECAKCKEAAHTARMSESARRCERSRHAVAEHARFDDYSEGR